MLLQPVEEIDNGIKVEVVSIPQAVGAVATGCKEAALATSVATVSIPQAVGAVATLYFFINIVRRQVRFNTASGRCCCNEHSYALEIPEGVEFQYRKR